MFVVWGGGYDECTTVHLQIVLQLVSLQLSCLYQVHISSSSENSSLQSFYFSHLPAFSSHISSPSTLGTFSPTILPLSTSGLSAPPPSPLFSLVTHEAKEATSFAPQPHSPSSVSPSPHQHYLLEKWKRTVPARATSSSSFFLGTLTLLLLLSSLCLSSILLSSTICWVAMLDSTVLKCPS